MNIKTLIAPLALFTLVGCGGVSDSTAVADLTAEDITSLCEEFNGAIPATTCTTDFGDLEMGGETVAECSTGMVFSDICTATVQDIRACNDAVAADPCVVFTAMPATCLLLQACTVVQ